MNLQIRFKLLILSIPLILLSSCSPGLSRFGRSLGNSLASNSTEKRVEVCAKYGTQYGWSEGYSVTGNILKGSKLNSETGSYNYNSYSTYVVIFWDDDQASVIELNSFYGSISASGNRGTDQRGLQWLISSSSLCY